MAEPTMEQVAKENEDLKAKIAELEKAGGGDGGNADAAKARKLLDDLKKDKKALEEKLNAYEAEKAEAEKAKMSEVERLKAEKAEAEAKAKAADEALARSMKENAFGFAAMQAGCSNVADAIKLADLGSFKADDPDAAKSFVEEFKKAKPYLFSAKDGGNAQLGTKGADPRPGEDKADQAKIQKLEEAKKSGDPLAALKALTQTKP